MRSAATISEVGAADRSSGFFVGGDDDDAEEDGLAD